MIDVPLTDEFLLGSATAADGGLERTARGVRPHRLPSWLRERWPEPQLMAMEAQPSGVRLELRTAAGQVELVLHPRRVDYVGAPRPRGAVDVVVDGELLRSESLTGGDAVQVDLRDGSTELVTGSPHRVLLELPSPGEHHVQLWLPHTEEVEILSARADAPVRPAEQTGPRWIHYGSSISQGSNATHPTGIWPVVAARAAGMRLRNLAAGRQRHGRSVHRPHRP
ncbi:hypothetical protein [Brachybacterium sp. GCM10030252]|uniref:hypothetical protein n=1 Tax=Brachybacterium sp. GCM10030252 TaxID=3273380 RepID=UPI0036083650